MDTLFVHRGMNMKMPFFKYEKFIQLEVNYSALSVEEINKIKEVLESTKADFRFMNQHNIDGKKSTIFGFAIPFLDKEQYRKIKGL